MADSAVSISVTVALSLLSLYMGMIVANAQQDREALTRQRGVAKALLAELDRIDAELARMKETGLLPWTGRSAVPAPTIHRWIEALISQVADEAPDVVAGFMRLEIALALMAETADRARTAYLEVDAKFQDYDVLERRRREQYDRGKYDTATGRLIPPGPSETYEELPEDLAALTKLASADTTLRSQTAIAKLAWNDAVQTAKRLGDEYRYEPLSVIGIVFRLKERLYVIARRPLPRLSTLAMRIAVPLREDSELARVTDEAALQEIRKGERRF